jgi:hypothetical protein
MAKSRRGHFLVLLTHTCVRRRAVVSHHIYLNSCALWPTTYAPPCANSTQERYPYIATTLSGRPFTHLLMSTLSSQKDPCCNQLY